MKSEEQIHYRLKELQARYREIAERISVAGEKNKIPTWDMQSKLDEYNRDIALLRWVLEG